MPRGAENPKLYVREISDQYIRQNFQNLSAYFDKQNQLVDFNFFDVSLSEGASEQRVRHGLGRAPRDLIRCEASGAGIVTFHRGLFDDEFMYLSSTGECSLRFFAGTYKESPNPPPAPATLVEQWIVAVRNKLEVLTGAANGENKNFSISELPLGSTFVKIYEAGSLLSPEAYTIEGKEITMVEAPDEDAVLLADYLY